MNQLFPFSLLLCLCCSKEAFVPETEIKNVSLQTKSIDVDSYFVTENEIINYLNRELLSLDRNNRKISVKTIKPIRFNETIWFSKTNAITYYNKTYQYNIRFLNDLSVLE